MATPVGWGLALAAATTALSLGGYKSWQFFSKRWDRLEKDESGERRPTGERVRLTLAFWKKVGGGKREAYAEALYDYAVGGAPALAREALDEVPDPVVATLAKEQARATLEALGLHRTSSPWRMIRSRPRSSSLPSSLLPRTHLDAGTL